MARQLQSYSALPADPKGAALSALAKKLRLRPDDIVAVLNAPQGYLEYLSPGPTTIVTELKPDHRYEAVQLFVDGVEQLRAMSGAALAALKPDGMLWITHRKGQLKNDALSGIFNASGYRPVSFVKVDETWMAVRLKKG